MNYIKTTPLHLKYCFLFFTLFFIAHSETIAQTQKANDWQLKKFEKDIAVYNRNSSNSNFKELKSITTVKTSLQSLVALLNDWDTYPEWVFRCEKSSTIKKINDKEVIHYQTVTAPWPVENRDFVVHVKLSQNEKTKTITITSECVADYIPKEADHVRIQEFKASWTLIPLKDGSVEVIYQLLINPGGNIPAWLVNMAVVEGPYETLTNLKTRVLKEKYQKASVNFIQEKD